jgi:hypothetical protein
MPKKKPLLPRPLDVNEIAFRFVRAAVGDPVPEPAPTKNAAAVSLGRKGGKAGGKARAAALSPKKKKAIAKKAADSRWGKKL